MMINGSSITHKASQIIAGPFAGWIGSAASGAVGAVAGMAVAVVPSLLLKKDYVEPVATFTYYTGAIAGGAAGSAYVAGRRGLISYVTTSSLLFTMGYLNSLDQEKKQKILKIFKK